MKEAVLEGCLGDWSKKSYIRPLSEKAQKSEIYLYAVDIRNIRENDDMIELYEKPITFINKKRDNFRYNAIDNVDFVFIVTPPESHCRIAENWLKKGKLNENGRIFIEKPLDSTIENIEKIGKFEEAEKRIISIDHYIPKIPPLIKELEKKKEYLGQINKIRFDILETDQIPDSRKTTLDEGLILDIFPHILGIFTKIINMYNKKLDVNFFEISSVNTGKYRSSPIRGETFAEIIIGMDGIQLESCIGKAVGSRDRKIMKISFERGVLIADFTEGNFSIKVKSEHIVGILKENHICMLLDFIVNKRSDDKITELTLNFREGSEIVRIISKIRANADELLEYEKSEPLESILMRFKESGGKDRAVIDTSKGEI